MYSARIDRTYTHQTHIDRAVSGRPEGIGEGLGVGKSRRTCSLICSCVLFQYTKPAMVIATAMSDTMAITPPTDTPCTTYNNTDRDRHDTSAGGTLKNLLIYGEACVAC